jgi:RHS repeat-associated protein
VLYSRDADRLEIRQTATWRPLSGGSSFREVAHVARAQGRRRTGESDFLLSPPLVSRLVGLLVAACVWAASPGLARAQCQLDCDPLFGACVSCEGFTPLFDWNEISDELKPVLDVDTGMNAGAAAARRLRDRFQAPAYLTQLLQPPTRPGDGLSDDFVAANHPKSAFTSRAGGLAAALGLQAALEAAQHRAAAGAALPNVPLAQGTSHSFDAEGDSLSAAIALDPVDPLTGEFIHTVVDLELPSFGVPFRHTRTYRSRVDFRGPFGPAWDHGYNQVLRELADVELSAPPPPATAPNPAPRFPALTGAIGTWNLVNQVEGSGCGPALGLSTGQGSMLQFREIGRNGATIEYRSQVARLTLVGTINAGVTTWALSAPTGEVRHFDAQGRLSRWVDANGVGLTLVWGTDPSGQPRVTSVTDSAGRLVTYVYDAAGRVTSVTEGASLLQASYTYDANGLLSTAHTAKGKSERYEYTFAATLHRGTWIPEGMLEAVCEQTCAATDASCEAGGACDQAVQTATAECLASCEPCALDCRAQCPDACGDACRNGSDGCAAAVSNLCEQDPATVGALRDGCVALYNEERVDRVCDSGYDVCTDIVGGSACGASFVCTELGGAGSGDFSCSAAPVFSGDNDFGASVARIFGGFLDALQCLTFLGCDWDSVEAMYVSLCESSFVQCCVNGANCDEDSCNEGVSYYSSCAAGFLGFGAAIDNPRDVECRVISSSPSREDAYGGPRDSRERTREQSCLAVSTASCIEDGTSACMWGVDEPVPTTGCMPPCLGQCESQCDSACDRYACPAACAELDLAATCEATCKDECVAAGRGVSPFNWVKYGYEADLNYNLLRIYDGNGQLYLTNEYGTDWTQPNFDTVVSQQYGASTGSLWQRDLRAEADGYPSSAPTWAAAPVDTQDEFETVDICPFTCNTPSDLRGDVFVPVGDVLYVFDDANGVLGTSGFSVPLSPRAAAIPAAFMSFSGSGSNMVGRVGRRRSLLNPLGTTAQVLPLSSPAGDLTLSISSTGVVAVGGDAAAKGLLSNGLTWFTDAAMVLHAYPGAPKTAMVVSSGSCTQPFRLQRVSDTEVVLDPASACSGDLWVTPVASPSADNTLGGRFLTTGQAAVTTSTLRPTVFAPARATSVWRTGIEGRRIREVAPSNAGTKAAETRAASLYTSVPIFSAPDPASVVDPLFVFHHRQPDYTPPAPGAIPPVPTDDPYQGFDPPSESFVPPCDPTTPDPLRVGSGATAPGPKPTHATLLKDFDGTRWVLYSDASHRLLRRENAETGAAWSFNYDSLGQQTAGLGPDGTRVCLSYDARGQLSRRLTVPAPVPGLPTPSPVREEFRSTDAPTPARVTYVGDPLRPGQPALTATYDAAGNLTSTTQADGQVTTVMPVATTAARGLPATITAPGNAVTAMVYDPAGGGVAQATSDASGTAPLTSSVTYDEAGRVVWRQSPLGFVETFSFGGPLLEQRAWSGDGKSGTETYTYDADGQLVAVVRGQLRTTARYTVAGHVDQVQQIAVDGTATTITLCRNISDSGRVLEEVGGEGIRTRYSYDAEGRVVEVQQGALGASAAAWDNNCLSAPTGGTATATTVRYSYDLMGRTRTVTDARGKVTTFVRDALGRPVKTLLPDGTQVWRGFDAVGEVVWEAAYANGGVPAVYRMPLISDSGLMSMVEVVRDVRGRVQTTKQWHFSPTRQWTGDGIVQTSYAYDDVAHRVTVTDDSGAVTWTQADGAGRPVQARSPDGALTTWLHEPALRRMRQTSPTPGGLVTTQLEVTSWGAPLREALVVGTAVHPTGSYDYDNLLRSTKAVNTLGSQQVTTYDAFGRPTVVAVQTPGVAGVPVESLSLSYNRDHQPVRRISTGGNVASSTWLFAYDALGRAIRTTNPSNQVTTTTYVGGSGLPYQQTDERGVVVTSTYDDSRNLTLQFADAPSPTLDVSQSYSYDALGRMRTASRTDGTQAPVTNSWTWDSLGNPLSESDNILGGNHLRSHGYDGRGLAVSDTLGMSATTSLGIDRVFDAMGRAVTITVKGDPKPLARWDYPVAPGASGTAALKKTLYNDVRTTYGYDALGRLTTQAEAVGQAAAFATWTHQVPLDGVPRRAQLTRGPTVERRVTGVDVLGRLTAEDSSSTSAFTLAATTPTTSAQATTAAALTTAAQKYTLDARAGRVSTMVGTTTTAAFTRDVRDVVTQVSGVGVTNDARGALLVDGTTTLAYDALGAVSRIQVGAEVRTLRRDALGRVVTETNQAGAVTSYGWDGAVRVLRKRSTGVIDVTVDKTGAGAAPDEHVAMLAVATNGTQTRTYPHLDRQGSVFAVSDLAGAVKEWWSYTAWGEPTVRNPAGSSVSASPTLMPYGYHGAPHDLATRLVDMRFRVYRPSWGRFVSPDPLGLVDGSNRFAFVGGAVLSYRDPWGLCKRCPRSGGGFGLDSDGLVNMAAPDFDLLDPSTTDVMLDVSGASPGWSRETKHDEVQRRRIQAAEDLALSQIPQFDGPPFLSWLMSPGQLDPDSNTSFLRLMTFMAGNILPVAASGGLSTATTATRAGTGHMAARRFTSNVAGEAFDAAKLARIQTSLESQGVTFVTGQEGGRLAAALGGEAVYIPEVGRPGIIAWGTNPSRAAVVEELVHLGQHRALGWADVSGRVVQLEIAAQHQLLQIGTRLGWTEAELSQIDRALQTWIGM